MNFSTFAGRPPRAAAPDRLGPTAPRRRPFFPALSLAAALVAAAPAQILAPDSCANALPIYAGTNPLPPQGSSNVAYSNFGASASPAGAFAGCAPFYNDVWFLYTAPRTGNVAVYTCTPLGFAPGTFVDTCLAVYAPTACATGAGAAPIVCSDDSAACGGGNLLKSYAAWTACAGQSYLVRVGSHSPASAGTFFVTVLEPDPLPSDVCASALPLPLGTTTYDQSGTTLTALDPTCGQAPVVDRWFSYWSGFYLGGRTLKIALAPPLGGAAGIAAYAGSSCAAATPLFCGGTMHEFRIQPNTTYYFRAYLPTTLVPASLAFTLDLAVADAPVHDVCAAAFDVGDGAHPAAGDDPTRFANFGAAAEPADGGCGLAPINSDVFFRYRATTSGRVAVTTATPPGASPGTLGDTVLAVLAACGGPVLACDDDGGPGTLSALEFDAVHGVDYWIRVGDYGAPDAEGTFHLTITPRFALALSSPAGPGSFRLRDEFGAPNHAVFNALTLHAGSYPTGPFFGIAPTFTELFLQISSGAEPFLAPLSPAGSYQFDATGLPALTVYGVALQLDLAGALVGVSPPATVAIL